MVALGALGLELPKMRFILTFCSILKVKRLETLEMKINMFSYLLDFNLDNSSAQFFSKSIEIASYSLIEILGHGHGLGTESALFIESHILFCTRQQHFVSSLGLGNMRQLQNNAMYLS